MQIIDVPVAAPGPKEVQYDPDWLAILRETHAIMNLSRSPTRFPTAFAAPPPAAAEHRAAVDAALAAAGGPAIPPDGFARTVDPGKRGQGNMPTAVPRNPQTEAVLRLIGRPWNLGGEAGAAALGVAGVVPLTGDDLLGREADAAVQVGGDTMFEAVDIHNMDPHAISDARAAASAEGNGKAVGDGVGGGGPGTTVRNPEEIDIDGSSDDG